MEDRTAADAVGGGPTLVHVFARGIAGRSPRQRLGHQPVLLGPTGITPLVRSGDTRIPPGHAEVSQAGESWTIRDGGGAGATLVNGRRLRAAHTLAPGDVVRVGDTLAVYVEDPCSPAHEDVELAGGSGTIGAVVRSMDAVARRMHTVVITGETGTGKEVVAQRIHELSGRTGAFIAVNCAVCSDALLAAELFGHVRGAFTGALADQPGLFRAARGGTVLLDEMADMPLALQAMLLRVVETRTVRPVGATRDVPIDIRLLVTTNREIVTLVQAGLFRADLYARLSQWTIRVPPLRARMEDIPALTASLLSRCGAAGRPLSADLASALLLHDWPLNIRGLLNVLSISAITSPELGPLTLTEHVRTAMEWSMSMTPPAVVDAVELQPTRSNLEDILLRFDGRVASAARHLGMTRTRLYRLLALHSIVPALFRPGPARLDPLRIEG